MAFIDFHAGKDTKNLRIKIKNYNLYYNYELKVVPLYAKQETNSNVYFLTEDDKQSAY